METQEFKGIWIPKEICNLKNLGWTEKLLLSEVYTLSYQKNVMQITSIFQHYLVLQKKVFQELSVNLLELDI